MMSRAGFALNARRVSIAALFFGMMVLTGCATTGTSTSFGVYGGYGYYDSWYWGGCCYRHPGGIGPPPVRPRPPTVRPPGSPSNPVARPPSRPVPMPRPAMRR
jgi:hypothetical protein